MSKDEALRLALDALENHIEDPRCDNLIEKLITAIKEALAQTEQDGKCKHCIDGCPACDARKLSKEAHDLF